MGNDFVGSHNRTWSTLKRCGLCVPFYRLASTKRVVNGSNLVGIDLTKPVFDVSIYLSASSSLLGPPGDSVNDKIQPPMEMGFQFGKNSPYFFIVGYIQDFIELTADGLKQGNDVFACNVILMVKASSLSGFFFRDVSGNNSLIKGFS